ncbi:MAG: glycoside hydrolase family 28 protein [Acholeplasmatales bacterium]|nr:glycoside hydrolase family 28 protein [Acholeplasmatales bacterium]
MNFEILRPEFKNVDYDITNYGAKSDIAFNNQKAIQEAINDCHNNGGGRVIIPDGFYITGPIELKSNVNLYVADNAYVQFTKSKEEYPLYITEYEGIKHIRAISPISADGCENVAITGKGVMDGAGDLWRGIKQFKLTQRQWDACLKKSPYVIPTKEGGIWCPTKSYYDGVVNGGPDVNDPNALEKASQYWDMYRPVFVSIRNCNKVLIEDVTLQNSPAWNVHPIYCNNLTVNRAVIRNKYHAQNGDGIDVESCTNVEIANSVFEVGDDGICLKSGKNREARQIKRPTKNVWIHDCKVFDAHGGFVVGSEMSRGVSNVIVENCVFSGTDVGIRFKSALGRGGVVEDITIKNIFMSNIIKEAMIFTMGYVLHQLEKADGTEISNSVDMDDVPEFKNITVDNVVCNGSEIALKVVGLEELPIHDITITNSKIAATNGISTVNCKNIKLDNLELDIKGEKSLYNSFIINDEFKC